MKRLNVNQILKRNLEDLSREEQKAVTEALCERFLIEHKKNDKSGIYGFTQYRMAYHSNKMEGSTLTENQTKSLFDTVRIFIGRRMWKKQQGIS